ncbi:F-box/kelch-repeat protein At1g26930-like [Prosopis cineraria]|uniref:F-box/kelch-repeat protein At1g26930-like n=1 Tax=Prosopis cineraria TaxID=364024 RepID=UPI00240F8B53|nr:F-box/kelch-repeat protein At1g26930-like [Prosopis cineraria]
MLDGRSCVFSRLFSSTCPAENNWSFMKYLPELDIKNGKRPLEIDGEDGPRSSKLTKILDQRAEGVRILHEQQSCQDKDSLDSSVIPSMDQDGSNIPEQRKHCEPFKDFRRVEMAAAGSNQPSDQQEQHHAGDSSDSVDSQSHNQQQAGDSSHSGDQQSDEQQQRGADSLNSGNQQSDEQQQQQAGNSSASGSLFPRMNRDSSIACLSRCSRSDYGSLASLNRSFWNLIRSGELYTWRRLHGIIEHWIYFSCELLEWEAYDPIRQRWMHLPRMASNECFMCSDKESLAVGTELLVFGKEMTSHVIYRYSLLTNSWTSGKSMNAPRCLFGSASLGEVAILAGGCDSDGRILSSAELYNSETQTWDVLPSMNKPRKMCSGVFMDGKFYVIGGIGGPESKLLTCGEEYNLHTRTWTEIPSMSPGRSARGAEMPATAEAPPLVAVVNNELYAADYADMEVKKYDKVRKQWSVIGRLPERAVSVNGWGLAFRACGNRLIVIGGPRTHGEGFIELNAWVPSEGPPEWNLLARKRSGNFVYNCAVMGC